LSSYNFVCNSPTILYHLTCPVSINIERRIRRILVKQSSCSQMSAPLFPKRCTPRCGVEGRVYRGVKSSLERPRRGVLRGRCNAAARCRAEKEPSPMRALTLLFGSALGTSEWIFDRRHAARLPNPRLHDGWLCVRACHSISARCGCAREELI